MQAGVAKYVEVCRYNYNYITYHLLKQFSNEFYKVSKIQPSFWTSEYLAKLFLFFYSFLSTNRFHTDILKGLIIQWKCFIFIKNNINLMNFNQPTDIFSMNHPYPWSSHIIHTSSVQNVHKVYRVLLYFWVWPKYFAS